MHGALGRRMRADLHGGVGRAFARLLASEREHATRARSHEALEARIVRVRPALTPCGDRAVDERRVRRRELRTRHTERLGTLLGAGEHDHVRVACQREQLGARGRLLQVELAAALAAQPQRPRRQAAERVPARRLHEQHVGAEVRQHHRGQRTRRPAAEVEHADAREWCLPACVAHRPAPPRKSAPDAGGSMPAGVRIT